MPRQYDNPQERNNAGRKSGRYVGRYEQRPAAGKGKKKKKTGLIVLCVVLVLLAAVAIAGWTIYNSVLDKITYVEVPKIQYTQPPTEAPALTEEPTEAVGETTEATTEATEPHVASREDYINFLLVGQAAREGAPERFADTMILCTVNTHEKTLTLTSLLRDTYARRPAWTDFKGVKHTAFRDKLTKVYHMGSYFTAQSGGTKEQQIAGSMELMNLALYDNFGIEVDYNFEVDFEIFMELVNLLDGVPVVLDQAEADYMNGKHGKGYVYREMVPGATTLFGAEALCYVRMRKADGDGDSDIKRTVRQRAVIDGILKALQKKGLSKVQEIANELLPMVTTSMTKAEISDMMVTMLKILPDLKIVSSGTCPANYKGDLLDIFGNGEQHSVLYFDEVETKKLMRALTLGEGEIPAAE